MCDSNYIEKFSPAALISLKSAKYYACVGPMNKAFSNIEFLKHRLFGHVILPPHFLGLYRRSAFRYFGKGNNRGF